MKRLIVLMILLSLTPTTALAETVTIEKAAGDVSFFLEITIEKAQKKWPAKCDGRNGKKVNLDFITPEHPVIQDLASQMSGLSLAKVIEVLHLFEPQNDLNGCPDGYAKYPVETILDGGGDCMDLSYLAVSVLRALGYDTVIFIYPWHYAVGIADPKRNYGVYFLDENGTKYYFLEMMVTQSRLGEIAKALYEFGQPKIVH